MAVIDTTKLTSPEIAKILWTEDLLDDVKAVEEEVSTITVVKDEYGRKKQWIEETRDLDGYLLSKRIEDHAYLEDGRTNTITHRVYDGAELYKQWVANDQTQQITVEVDHVRKQYFSEISEETGTIIPEEGVTIILDSFTLGLDALVCGLNEKGQPSGETVYGPQRYIEQPVVDEETGEVVDTLQVPIPQKVLRATLDMAGNYILNDVPASPPVALIYLGEVRVNYPLYRRGGFIPPVK